MIPLSNLGVIAKEQGRFDDALALFQRALHITERVYGPDHPDVADALTNMATVFKHEKKLDEAETMTIRALAATEKAYGAGHTRVAMGLTNLGDIQATDGHTTEALASYGKSLALFEAKLGPMHVYLSYPLYNMGLLYIDLKRPAEARPPLERALAIRVTGKMPPGPVAEVRFALAKVLAADPHERARARREATTALAEFQSATDPEDVTAVKEWLRRLP